MANISNYNDYTLVSGGAGNDVINNEGANVSISGGNGNDVIDHRYRDNATISGGAGADDIRIYYYSNVSINGGAGSDLIENWGANALFIYSTGDGNDTFADSTKRRRCKSRALTPLSKAATILS